MNSNATEGVRRFSWDKAEFKTIWIILSSSILWYDIHASKRLYIPFEAVARSVEVSELEHKKSRKHGAQLKKNFYRYAKSLQDRVRTMKCGK